MVCSLSDLDHCLQQRGATAREPNLGEDSSFSSSSCCALEDGYPQRARRSSRSTGRQRQLLAPGRHLLLLCWATVIPAVDPRHLSTSPPSACCLPIVVPAQHAVPLMANASNAITSSSVPILWCDGQTCCRCESCAAAGCMRSTNARTDCHLHRIPTSHGPAVTRRYAMPTPIATAGAAAALPHGSVAVLPCGTEGRGTVAYWPPCKSVPNISSSYPTPQSRPFVDAARSCSGTPHAPARTSCLCPTQASAISSTGQAGMCRVRAAWHPSDPPSPPSTADAGAPRAISGTTARQSAPPRGVRAGRDVGVDLLAQ